MLREGGCVMRRYTPTTCCTISASLCAGPNPSLPSGHRCGTIDRASTHTSATPRMVFSSLTLVRPSTNNAPPDPSMRGSRCSARVAVASITSWPGGCWGIRGRVNGRVREGWVKGWGLRGVGVRVRRCREHHVMA